MHPACTGDLSEQHLGQSLLLSCTFNLVCHTGAGILYSTPGIYKLYSVYTCNRTHRLRQRSDGAGIGAAPASLSDVLDAAWQPWPAGTGLEISWCLEHA